MYILEIIGLMLFDDFRYVGETEGRRERGLFTRYDYRIRRCQLGSLAARRSESQFFLCEVYHKKVLNKSALLF